MLRRLVTAPAGFGLAGVVTGVKGGAARARVHGIRVVNCEARAHQAVDVIDLRAPNVRGAEVVDYHLDTVLLDHDVVRPAIVVERHTVLHARAASTADEDAESQLRVAFLGEKFLEVSLGFGGE